MQRRISKFIDKNGKSWPRIETHAETLTAAFVEAARGLRELIVPATVTVDESESVTVFCESSDLEFLLADWINTLIYEMNVREMVFSRFDVEVEGIHVRGKVYGERWESVKKKMTEKEFEPIQGVAFDALQVQENESGWETSLVLNDRARHPFLLRSFVGFLMVLGLMVTSACSTAREKADQRAGAHVSDFSKKKMIESFDLLTLLRVAADGTNLCGFQGEELALVPQTIRGRIDSWARGLPLDEGLPSVKELNECASSCRCPSYVYWLDQKGAYPSELNSGYSSANRFAAKMTNAQALACAKKLKELCNSDTLKTYRNEAK